MEHLLSNGLSMIIITGASKGIGAFLYEKFSSLGYDVVGIYNSTIPSMVQEGNYYKVDIANSNEVCNWVESIKDRLSELVLVNCAGISYNAFAHKASIDKWQNVIKVNLFGTFNIIHFLLPIMREQKFGRIINFSSVVTQIATPGISAYAASKSALVGLTKSLAAENASKGVTVNSINLGYVEAGMGIYDVPESYQKILKEKLPTGKFCNPADVFNTVDFIMKTEYLNGASIDLNGLLF